MTHRITAVLLNYNHSAFLPQVLADLAAQTEPFDEILIVDDASTDDSVAVIQAHLTTMPNARLIQNPTNCGVIENMNVGMREAAGEFVYYVSADDRYHPEIVAQCKAALAQFPDIAMVSGNTRICNVEDGTEHPFTLPFALGRHTRESIAAVAKRRNVTFYGGGNLIRRDVLLELHGSDPALKWHADWLLYLLVAYRYPFAVVPLEFLRMRQAGDQYSHACYDWAKQKPVIRAFILLLKNSYPAEYQFFKRCALMPLYQFPSLLLMLREVSIRDYLTPLLCWRLVTYRPLQIAGRLMPLQLRGLLRQLLRV